MSFLGTLAEIHVKPGRNDTTEKSETQQEIIMALLGQLLPDENLAHMTNDQKEFLVQTLNHLLNDQEVQELLADKLQPAVNLVDPSIKAGVYPKYSRRIE